MTSILARPARPVQEHISATGRRGMVTTSHPAATEAGLTVLRAGGSAVDAFVAAAAVQTVVEPTMTSLAGGLVVTVFDPAVGHSRLVLGVGARPAAESGAPGFDEVGYWSGRTVVAPGWVSAAHAAWERWGKVDWSMVLAPAARAAHEGFVVDNLLHGWMHQFRASAGRHQSGRDVWFPDGHLVGVGDVVRQPALARTIERLANEGPDYFYLGDFAQNFVAVAQQAGGRITLDDLAGVRPAVVELPTLPTAGGYELQTSGPLYALLLSMAHLAGLAERGRPDEDPEVLYLMLRMIEECWHYGSTVMPGSMTPPEKMLDAVSPESAARLLDVVLNGPPRPFDGLNMGTNAIVAVDESGLIAHGTHSSTSHPFGVGLMADGVIVPRPANLIVPAGGGTSLLALRNGRPVLATGAPSASLFQNVFQTSLNVLERGMSLVESVGQPMFGASVYPSRRPMVEATMGEGIIAEVEKRGIGLWSVSPWEPEMGSAQAVSFDLDGTLHGVADPRRLGRAAGY